jgi:hypothetical protein
MPSKTTVANSRAAHVLAAGGSRSDALVAGFHRGLLLSALFCAGMFLVSLASPRLAPGADRVAGAATAA